MNRSEKLNAFTIRTEWRSVANHYRRVGYTKTGEPLTSPLQVLFGPHWRQNAFCVPLLQGAFPGEKKGGKWPTGLAAASVQFHHQVFLRAATDWERTLATLSEVLAL